MRLLIHPGTYLDKYHEFDQLARLFNSGLKRNTPEGLRDRTMAAACHSGLLRGQDCRGMQLPDVQYLSLGKLEGPTPCDVMVVLIFDGKTNKDGKAQYMAAMRHKRWDLCSLSSFGFWFFNRWVIYYSLQISYLAVSRTFCCTFRAFLCFRCGKAD